MVSRHSCHGICIGSVRLPVVGGVVGLALAINVIVSLILVPVTANPYDFALITGSANAWLNWHLSLFLYWKFGIDYAGINLAAACGARVLSAAGLTVPAAAHISFKLLLVLANLLAALALWKLCLRYRPRLAVTLTVLWLLSPVVVWVAAFHGQIEPVSAAATLWALWFVADRRWLLAGVVTGIGVGFEYVPIVVLVTVACLVMAKRARIVDGVLYAFGLGVTLVIVFAQLFVSRTGAQSLHQGIVGHATASGTGANVKPGSIWYLIDPKFVSVFIEPHWLLLLAVLAVATSLIAVRSVRHGSETAAFAAAGVVLLSSTILDPTILPQFGVLALVGLILITFEASIPVFIIAAAPAFILLGYVFVQPMYAYFEDVDPHVLSQVPSLLPQFPLIPFMYPKLASIGMELGIIAIGIWAVHTARISRHRVLVSETRGARRSMIIVMVIEVLVLLLAVIWTVQPRLWAGVIGSNPNSLFDTPYLTSRRADITTIVGGSSITGVFDPQLLAAVKSTHPAPVGVIGYTPRVVASQRSVGRSLPRRITVRIPVFQSDASLRVTTIGISVLVHNRAWLSAGLIVGRAYIDGQLVVPDSKSLVLPTWAMVDYQVPVSDIITRAGIGVVSLRFLSRGTIANAATDLGPWFMAWDGAGEVLTGTNNGGRWSRFEAPTIQRGRVFLTVSEIRSHIDVPALSDISSFVRDEALIWPNSSSLFARPDSLTQWLVGIVYLVGLLLALVFVGGSCFGACTSAELRIKPGV